MDGSLNWHNPAVSTKITETPGSHTAPKNWLELKIALLDCLMPSNSVEDSALWLAEFKIDPGETVASYVLRFQSECTRFEACVQRVTPGRSPYAALSVVLFRNGVVPGIRLLASQEHPKTMSEAVAQLHRHEAANFTGSNTSRINAHVSATSFTIVPNRTTIAQQYDAISLQAASGNACSGCGGSGSGGAGTCGPNANSLKRASPPWATSSQGEPEPIKSVSSARTRRARARWATGSRSAGRGSAKTVTHAERAKPASATRAAALAMAEVSSPRRPPSPTTTTATTRGALLL